MLNNCNTNDIDSAGVRSPKGIDFARLPVGYPQAGRDKASPFRGWLARGSGKTDLALIYIDRDIRVAFLKECSDKVLFENVFELALDKIVALVDRTLANVDLECQFHGHGCAVVVHAFSLPYG